MILHENRTNEYNRALITVATGPYNQYIPTLITSAQEHFACHIYIFTDEPEQYQKFKDVTTIKIPHLGWPMMPLMRFDLLHRHMNCFKENYLFLIDSEARFDAPISNGILHHRVATLHRNIMRFRDQFNYETRLESKAYVGPGEGEKYYACGFVGGHKTEFRKMCETIARNIWADVYNGIRARWGDESHLNRYLIDNRPTMVLPPNYMCPYGNAFFKPFITHRDKKFKRVNIEHTEDYLTVNPDDYKDVWKLNNESL